MGIDPYDYENYFLEEIQDQGNTCISKYVHQKNDSDFIQLHYYKKRILDVMQFIRESRWNEYAKVKEEYDKRRYYKSGEYYKRLDNKH